MTSRRVIPLVRIVKAVAARCGVTIDEMYGRGRHPQVVFSRRVYVVLARRLTIAAFPEISGGICQNHPSSHGQYRTALEPENWKTIGPVVLAIEDDLTRKMVRRGANA